MRSASWALSLAAVGTAAIAGAAAARSPALSALFLAVPLLAWLAARPAYTIPVVVTLLALPVSGSWVALGDSVERKLMILVLVGWGVLWARVSNTPRLALPKAVSRALLCLVVVPIYGLLQLLYTSYPSLVAIRVVEWVVALGLLLIAFSTQRRDVRALNGPVAAVVALGAVEALLGIAQFAAKSPLFMQSALTDVQIRESFNIPPLFRGLGTTYHANTLAIMLALTIPLGLLLLGTGRPWTRLLGALATPIMVLGLLSTLSRAGAAALLLLAVGAITFGAPRVRHRVAIVMALGSVVILVVLPLVPLLSTILGRFFGNASASRDLGSSLTRDASTRATVRAFEDRWVAGHGYGSSSSVGVEYGANRGFGAHNAYLDVLQGGGIVLAGLMLVGVIAVWMALRAAGVLRSPIAAGLLVFVAYGLVETVLQGLPLALAFTLVGVALRSIEQPSEVQVPNPLLVGRAT